MKKSKSAENIAINVSGVSKYYNKIKAVDDINFSATSGEIIALLGANGAGKSTLMNMIAGFLAPSEGEIFINGFNVATNDTLIKKNIGFLPEGSSLYADMTVRLFLQYLIELKLNLTESEQLTKSQIKETYLSEFNRIVKIAKIENVLSQKIETLSKGYLRRVGFAQSIIGNPPILLLDEPTDGLDPNQKEHMHKLITDMGRNKTIIISTHLLEEAKLLATRIILIDHGHIIVDGTLKKVLSLANAKTLEKAFKVLTTKGEE